MVEGIPATAFIRTLADVAVTAPFVTAVGVLDWAFARPGIAPDDVRADLDRRRIVRGRRRAERAVSLADGRSGSPGEALSRVRIHELGFPAPELQCRFADRHGLIGIVDFWWPEYRLIGEFDGFEKYVREAYTGGRTTAQVVIDEKRREDRLRALDPAPRGHPLGMGGCLARRSARREAPNPPGLPEHEPAAARRLSWRGE